MSSQPDADVIDPSSASEPQGATSENKDDQSAVSNVERKSISRTNRISADIRTAVPLLQPHIAIAGPTEFLVTVGTNETDPGVGMFVNHDGDIVRSTLEFGSYPSGVIVDCEDATNSFCASTTSFKSSPADGFVLAVTRQVDKALDRAVLEVHSLGSIVSGDAERSIIHLSTTDTSGEAVAAKTAHGIRSVREQEIIIPEMFYRLMTRRLDLSSYLTALDFDVDKDYESKRVKDETAFLKKLCFRKVRTVLWSGRDIYWVVRTPVLLQLDHQLSNTMFAANSKDVSDTVSAQDCVKKVINSIRGQTPQTEIDFLSLTYIQQKAALLFFQDILRRAIEGIEASDEELTFAQEALMECQIDPRVVLMTVPYYYKEVVQSREGLWVYNGLIELVKLYLRDQKAPKEPIETFSSVSYSILKLLKNFLMLWRGKKGFGSIADEQNVFNTVDAALLHILLELDKQSPKGPAKAGSIRAELNAVVDHGVECFDRAAALLEQYKRLYVLSRLYQNRKLSDKVLSTWKRIMEGEEDLGGELVDGEHEMRKYLTRIKDGSIVTEYGIWLAQKNTSLGVQVFADDNSRVQFEPVSVVALLKERAPNAVKDYLEYLVFSRKACHIHLQFNLLSILLIRSAA